MGNTPTDVSKFVEIILLLIRNRSEDSFWFLILRYHLQTDLILTIFRSDVGRTSPKVDETWIKNNAASCCSELQYIYIYIYTYIYIYICAELLQTVVQWRKHFSLIENQDRYFRKGVAAHQTIHPFGYVRKCLAHCVQSVRTRLTKSLRCRIDSRRLGWGQIRGLVFVCGHSFKQRKRLRCVHWACSIANLI